MCCKNNPSRRREVPILTAARSHPAGLQHIQPQPARGPPSAHRRLLYPTVSRRLALDPLRLTTPLSPVPNLPCAPSTVPVLRIRNPAPTGAVPTAGADTAIPAPMACIQ
jgi:hypothetical protein